MNGATAMSAYDVAIASRALLNNPELARMVSKLNYQFTGGDGIVHILTNHNDKLMTGYEGITGLKTGYTKKSGRTLAASATRADKSVIVIIIDVAETNQWAAKLLDDGFAYLANAKKNKIDLTKAKNKLPEMRPISTEAELTILKVPNVDIKNTSAKASQINSTSSYLTTLNISIFILLLIFFILYMRIRSVKKHRLRRKAERIRSQEVQRRKMLDVIDLTTEQQSGLISKK